MLLVALLLVAPTRAAEPDPTVRIALEPIDRPGLAGLEPLVFAAVPMDALQKRTGGVSHPDALARFERFVAPWFGFSKVVIGVEQPKSRTDTGDLAVAADVDLDGEIAATERTVLAWDGKANVWTGSLTTSFSRQNLDREPRVIPVVLQLRAFRAHPEGLRVTCDLERVRAGTLPDGRAIHAVSTGGVFDNDQAALVVDIDADGIPDHDELSARWTVDHGVLGGSEDQSWSFRVGSDGADLELTPIPTAHVARRSPQIGKTAPDFPVTDTNGVDRSRSTWSGSWVILDFWASWCGPCRAQHPELEALATAHGVSILGLANEEAAPMQAVLSKHPLPWPNAAIGASGDVVDAWSVIGIPKYALIDPKGTLIAFGRLDTIRHALAKHRPAAGIPTR